MKTRIFILNEWTILIFLVNLLVLKKIYFLDSDPFFPPFKNYLNWFAKFAINKKWAQHASILCHEVDGLWTIPHYTSIKDVFAKIEPWQDEYFRFNDTRKDKAYRLCFKQITCKYVQDRYIIALAIGDIYQNLKESENLKVFGLRNDAKALQMVWLNRNGHNTKHRRWNITCTIFNAIVAFAVSIYSVFWILSKTRFTFLKSNFYLAVDFIDDPRDLLLYDNIAHRGDILAIKRTCASPVLTIPTNSNIKIVTWGDGRFTPIQFLECLAITIRDSFKLWADYHWIATAHFYAISTLPHKRIIIRALFNRFVPKYFWGRDEYNVEPILRRQELNSIGGKSLGLMHGIQALADLNPQRRYLDFDIFYLFGRHLFDKHYSKSWPADMSVQTIGSYGYTKDQFLGPRTTNSNIVLIFLSHGIYQPEAIKIIHAIARSFPNLDIHVKPKSNDLTDVADELKKEFVANFENVHITPGSASDLIIKARYVLTDPSTVAVEAIHMQVPTMVLDILPNHGQGIFRDFPNLCVKNAKEAVEIIEGWENGTATFRPELYNSLVDRSGKWAFDIISDCMAEG
jgi:hypothetical protein